MPTYYGNKTVYEMALERIEYIFDEFENVSVNFSGGKDSTVTLNLALTVAEKKGRLPLKVMFIDQEAEWDCTIDYMKQVMYDPRIEPYWFQIPFRIFNATCSDEPWLNAWDVNPEIKWIREKDPIAIHKNPTKTDRFGELFKALGSWMFNGKPFAYLAGVRCEESPARRAGLTTFSTYKWVTWGKVEDKKRNQFVFYPLYDWSYKDIWKAIHDNSWSYCALYDYMYQYGISPMKMRLSNVTHETAVDNLFFLQEIEGDLWARLTQRLRGINTAGILKTDWKCPKELPFMFKDWQEYRDHLLENLITDPSSKKIMLRQVELDTKNYIPEIQEKVCKYHIDMILKNDYHGTKATTFAASHPKERTNTDRDRDKRARECYKK